VNATVNGGRRHQLLVEWNNTQSDYPNMPLSIFEAQVARNPDAVAVVFEDQQLTYAQLNCVRTVCTLPADPRHRTEVLVGICVERR